MRHLFRSLALAAALLLAAPVAATEKMTVSTFTTACASGASFVVELTDAANSFTCSTGSGTANPLCACVDGVAKVIADGAAPYNQTDPNKPPASCAVCDEFTNDTASLTWTWGNQDSSTLTVDLDSYRIAGDTASNALHVRGTDTPSAGNTDFTITVKFHASVAAANDGCAIGVIEAGSIATPTELTWLELIENGASDLLEFATATDYDFAGSAVVGSTSTPNVSLVQQYLTNYLQLRYTDSTRALTAWYSVLGFDFAQIGSSTTLSADPAYFFISARDGGTCRFEWVRARTDANRNLASD